MTAIIALGINGNLLGIHCSSTRVAKSSLPPADALIPPSLYPTPLQLSTPHCDWIDRFPFPRMRDNLIILADVVDTKELLFDFFTMRSFTVDDPGPAWNCAAWRVSPEWNQKWGYLFY